jgi:hypothetical protein
MPAPWFIPNQRHDSGFSVRHTLSGKDTNEVFTTGPAIHPKPF